MTARLFRPWTVPIVLLAVTLAAYGLFAAQQGFHWDDWGLIGLMSLRGPRALLDYFAKARPLWGYFYVATISLFGTNLLAWQVFALLMRWLAAVTLWWSLRLTWPRRDGFAFWAAVFALVYPGFSQHSIAVAYSHYSMALAMFYASLGLSLLALRGGRGRAAATLAALTLSALQLFSTEYFFGLELLRPILFWLALGGAENEPRRRWKRAALTYLPYGLTLAAFVVWRGFFFESQLYQVTSQASALASLPRQIWDGVWNASAAAWLGVFRLPPSAEMGTRLTLVYWLILLAVFALFMVYPNRLQSDSAGEKTVRTPILQWMGVGALAALTAGIPFYAARLPVQLKFPDDRFTQPFAFGVSLLLAAGLELLPRPAWRTAAASALVALAVGLQVQNAFFFREDWKAQKAYFWQLSWRVPALESGTSILSERAPFRFTDDDALGFATNWMYAPNSDELSAIHQVSMSTRLNFQSDTMKFTQPIQGRLFTSDFVVSSDALIVTQFAPPSCLRVLHPVYDADLPVAPRSREATESLLGFGLPFLRREEAAALPLSNMARIASADPPARPPEAIFGNEPPRQWCYYFEQADLARSQRNWEAVARLGDGAFAVPFLPNNPAEYLPFIEAYARLSRVDEARKLTMDAAGQMPILRPALCALWQRVAADGALSLPDRAAAAQIQTDLHYCPMGTE